MIEIDYSKLSEPFRFTIVSRDGQVSSFRGGRSFDPAKLDYSRYMEMQRTVNASHDSLSLPIGMAEKVWYDGKDVKADIRLLKDAAHAKPWLEALRSGVQRGISIEWDEEDRTPVLLNLALVGRGQDREAVRTRSASDVVYNVVTHFQREASMDWAKLLKAFKDAVSGMSKRDMSAEGAADAAMTELFDGMKGRYEDMATDVEEGAEAALEKTRAAYAKVGVEAEGDTEEAFHRAAMGDFAKGVQTLEGLRIKSEYFIKDRAAADKQRSASGQTAGAASGYRHRAFTDALTAVHAAKES